MIDNSTGSEKWFPKMFGVVVLCLIEDKYDSYFLLRPYPRLWGTLRNIHALRRPLSAKQIQEALLRRVPWGCEQHWMLITCVCELEEWDTQLISLPQQKLKMLTIL